MKVSTSFAVREIAGDYILVPLGEMALKFSGMITTNEVGAFIWECLQEDVSKEELLEKVLEEFEIDRETAEQDVGQFLENLDELGLME